MKFTKYKLGELLRITRGASLPGTGYADEGRYLRLTLANFHEEGGFKDFKSTQGKYFIEPFDSRFLMHKGNLITPLTEQSPGLLGSVAFIPCDDLYIQSQDVGLITCNTEKLDKTFAYYLFLTHSVREQISARSQQTKIRHTSPDKIADVEVYIPDLPTQLRIAGVLGSIDEKIELNRKKIAELEALAKTIYDYWFVQFDFPDKNGKPYKSSGGKMVWNDQLKREVPEGWIPWSISKCGHFHRGVSYSKENEVNCGADSISVYRGNNIARGFVVHDSNEVFIPQSMVSKSQILQRGQVLIAMSSGSKDHVGKAGLVTMSDPVCAFGAFCTVFEPDNVYRCFVYDFFRSATYRSYIKQICSGTGINNLKVEHLETDLFAIPDRNEIMDRFNSIQQPLYDQMMRLDEECATLQNTRDDLLPLLMNGQVEVRGDK